MDNTFKSFNKFHARGRITSVGMDNMGHISFTIVIRGKKPDIIRITPAHPLSQEIRLHSNVVIEGHIRAFSYMNPIRNKYVTVQYLVADKVEPDVPYLTKLYGVPARHCAPSEFFAEIQGEVTRVIQTQNPDWGKLRIRTDSMETDRRPSVIEVSYYKRLNLPAFDYEPGDKVLLWASIRTQQKEIDGSTVIFENLQVEDIVRLDDNGNYLEKKPKKEPEPANDEPVSVEQVLSEMEIDLPD